MCDSKLLRFPVTWVIRFFRFSHFDVSVNMYDYVKRIGLDPRCYGLFSYLIIYLHCHWAQTTGYHLTAIKIGLYHIYPSTVNRSNFGRIWDVCIFFDPANGSFHLLFFSSKETHVWSWDEIEKHNRIYW